ncbi:AAA family ATPase [Marinitenerispora sediminis]|uniref:AAA family ATPase n=1 Tax=Marinitenerispora sediminis TaxID=1931232 RepID=A0A368TBM0_9ACTN|nr:AAA family ATPase [Marinitenerispora sediminis]RCV52650.1 AAA family ATPase [Marinitenerispora sediminis]RCV60349.1 AAA family ATPase [Marinitenerispora sediminis]RCV60602.1 AAA family ATPase [Marinitenerispora sediminis]
MHTLPTATERNESPGGTTEILRYPARSLVLLGGIPGAGKSTLLSRLYGLTGTEDHTVHAPDGVRVVDSQASRNRLTPWLRPLPYPAWRWVVHVLHYLRVVAALRTGAPVIVHDTATRRLVRVLLGAYCRLKRVEVHLLLIDVEPATARVGQLVRGRMVTARSFRTHERRWRRLLAASGRGPAAVVPGAASLLLLDRVRAGRLGGIRFHARPAPVHGPAMRVLTCPAVYSAAMLAPL